VQTGSVGNSGALTQDVQIAAAQTRMAKKQMEQEGEAALKLIQSVASVTPDGNVGRTLNVVA